MKYFPDPIGAIENETKKINDSAEKFTRSAAQKYPFVFSLLFTFALVLVLHGFELVAVKIPFLNDYPVLMIVLGVVILLFTGSLYKNLNK